MPSISKVITRNLMPFDKLSLWNTTNTINNKCNNFFMQPYAMVNWSCIYTTIKTIGNLYIIFIYSCTFNISYTSNTVHVIYGYLTYLNINQLLPVFNRWFHYWNRIVLKIIINLDITNAIKLIGTLMNGLLEISWKHQNLLIAKTH